VVTVARPGDRAGREADAAVTAVTGAPLAIHTADCVPLVLLGDGAVGVAHAGWRGLAAGVVEAAVRALARLGPRPSAVEAVIGPSIRPECYEFGPADLDAVAAVLGDEVRAETAAGEPALDLAAGVRVALARAGVDQVRDAGVCTACDDRWFSHRARRDTGRQAGVAWLE
jgi:YfiH family protein